jgi:hypothetical protein
MGKNLWGDHEKNIWGDDIEPVNRDNPDQLSNKVVDHDKSDGTAYRNNDDLEISQKILEATDVKVAKEKRDERLEKIRVKHLTNLANQNDNDGDIQARLIKANI